MNNGPLHLTIGAVARQSGLRTSAIRYYESAGLLAAPLRINGRRLYSPDVLPRLALIAAAQRMGFTIQEIGTLMHGFEPLTPMADRWRALVAHKLPEVDALIARAQEMKHLLEDALQCGCLTLDACARTFSAGSSCADGTTMPRGTPPTATPARAASSRSAR